MDTSFLYDPIRIPFKGESSVCACHFDDECLRDFIEKNGVVGECSFCGKKSKVIDFASFIEHAQSIVYRYFGTLDDENLPSAFFHGDNYGFGFVREPDSLIGEIISAEGIHSLSTYQLLQELGLLTGESALDDAIQNCFAMGQEWIRHNPLSFSAGEWVSYYWKSFCDTIKFKRRFTVDELEFEGDHYGETISYSEVITQIFSAIRDAKMCKYLRAGTRLYRSRLFSEAPATISFLDLTSPPDEHAKQNRMSPAGISMFYSSLQAKTNIAEIGQTEGIVITGRFTLKNDVYILDLTDLPGISYWSKGNIGEMAFLHQFSREISKPIERDERIHIDYLPTQAFTEYIRHRFKDETGRSLDGIMYNSSIPNAGKNVVLFCDQMSSEQYVELTDYKRDA